MIAIAFATGSPAGAAALSARLVVPLSVRGTEIVVPRQHSR
jgi:hypothetical protein